MLSSANSRFNRKALLTSVCVVSLALTLSPITLDPANLNVTVNTAEAGGGGGGGGVEGEGNENGEG